MTCTTLHRGCLLLAVMFAAAPAAAQNPFVPPSGGLSKKQIEDIVRAEVARNGSTPQIAPTAPGTPPGAQGGVAGQMRSGTGSAVAAIPTQGGGQPVANTASDARTGAVGPGRTATALASSDDPVALVIADGGGFVGCVGMTPVFKDKDGRRAYFTSKELKLSNAARRYARCGA